MAREKAIFSLYKRKNGVYYVRLWDEASKSYTPAKSTGETNQLRAAAKAGEMVKAGRLIKRERNPLFVDALLRYWNERPDKEICAAYRKDIMGRIQKHIIPSRHLQGIRMSEVKHSHINRMTEDLKKAGIPASGINNLLKNLKTFIRWAERLDYLPFDFTSKITMAKIEKADRRGYLEPEEMQALSLVPWHDLRTRAAIHLGMYAGMRWGEVRALQWGDISFDDLTINIQRNFVDDWDKDGNPVYKPPKAGSFRKWPYLVFPELKNALLDLYRETPFKGPDDLVLVNAWIPKNRPLLKQYKPMNYHHVIKNFRKYLEAAGIPADEQRRRRLSYHALRHTFSSYMAAHAPASAVMPLTGHENIEVFEGYRHNVKSAAESALKTANEAMERYRAQARIIQ